jgi:hypothetical protein
MSESLPALLRRRDRLVSAPGAVDDAVLATTLAAIADHPSAAGHPEVDLAEVLGLLAESQANLRDLEAAIAVLERVGQVAHSGGKFASRSSGLPK